MFKGSYVALVTPMDQSGEVDYKSLEKCIEFHVDRGTDGIVAVGTTGESPTLSLEEHIKVVEACVHMADKSIPVIAGNGANSTREAIFLTQRMNNLDLSGFLSVVPYYNKPQERGLEQHFTAVAQSTKLPIILYNVPGRTVTDMQIDTIAKLAKIDNIVGLKDATGCIERYVQTRDALGDSFCLLSGDDVTSAEFLAKGGDGVISVSANVIPKEITTLCALSNDGKLEQAEQLNSRVNDIHHNLFLESNPVMVKWALYKMGLIATPTLRLPLVLPELKHQSVIEDLLNKHELI